MSSRLLFVHLLRILSPGVVLPSEEVLGLRLGLGLPWAKSQLRPLAQWPFFQNLHGLGLDRPAWELLGLAGVGDQGEGGPSGTPCQLGPAPGEPRSGLGPDDLGPDLDLDLPLVDLDCPAARPGGVAWGGGIRVGGPCLVVSQESESESVGTGLFQAPAVVRRVRGILSQS